MLPNFCTLSSLTPYFSFSQYFSLSHSLLYLFIAFLAFAPLSFCITVLSLFHLNPYSPSSSLYPLFYPHLSYSFSSPKFFLISLSSMVLSLYLTVCLPLFPLHPIYLSLCISFPIPLSPTFFSYFLPSILVSLFLCLFLSSYLLPESQILSPYLTLYFLSLCSSLFLAFSFSISFCLLYLKVSPFFPPTFLFLFLWSFCPPFSFFSTPSLLCLPLSPSSERGI